MPLSHCFSRCWASSVLLLALTTSPALAQPSESIISQSSTPQSEARMTEIAERFIDLVAAGKYEESRRLLNPRLREGWTAAQIRDDWEQLQRVIGAYKDRTATHIADNNLVLVDLEFERAADNLLVIFDDQQQIQGVDFPLQLPRL